jgi:AbrB family looped-hinge helix DNA binding protein
MHHTGARQDDAAMATLTVTARGQVTFRKDVLTHLGIKPGEKIELDKQPDGRIALRAAKPSGTIDGFLGLLAGKTKKMALVALGVGIGYRGRL